jgi:hypothetical protein
MKRALLIVLFANCFFCLTIASLHASYVDNGNGTVTDTTTGLMWKKVSSSILTWEQALAYCEGLSLGGYTDWRLPTKKELISLVDESRNDPSINTNYFPDTAASWYWSSTTHAVVTDYAFSVDFYFGFASANDKSDSYYARAVRGGQGISIGCTAFLDGNLLLYIPFISYDNPTSGILSLWADFVYAFNPNYPTLIPFQFTKYGIINNPSFSCEAATLYGDLKIQIPDVLLPDGITHLWVDLEYSQDLSTDGNFYWVVTNYGVVSN